ncbi:MAG: 2-oxo acid dehydrogenase subunit E2 [Elusimicrobia bacterium]|nr:2-oxo acid dehydrogenase subunit E2 [Elusimicrobiota bacterium]
MANDPLLVLVPKENVNDETVRLSAWRLKDRSPVAAGAVVAEIETSKAVIEVLSPAAGFLRHAAAEDSVVAVGGPLCWVTAGPEDPIPTTAQPGSEEGLFDTAAGARFSKKAHALALKHGVVDAFAGRGLVRESDVRAYLKRQGKAAAGQDQGACMTHLKGVSIVKEDLPRRKLAEIHSLSQGQNAGLSSLVRVPCPLAGYRKSLSRSPELAATPLALVVYETARLLRKHPVFNAFYEDGRLARYGEVHIGFVVDSGRGLAVPVVRDADKKDLPAVAREMQDLMLAYEEGSLSADAVSNGTFTVTDLSGEGAVSFHPLINERQSAILGIAAASGASFDLSLTFDHRLAEGRAACIFLKGLRDRLAGEA